MAEMALEKDEILNSKNIEIKEWDSLLRISGGDGRKLLNALEISVMSQDSDPIILDNQIIEKSVQKKLAHFDKQGDQHYDIISAFIKSIRGSDPNAAVYYLARMVEGGEDPKFIARRLLILASEDIGNANPNALLIALACFDAVSVIGYPECRINLSQTVIYLACSPKSNASYLAIKKAQQLVRDTGDLPVPLSIRKAPSKLMKQLGYGREYQYAHDFEGNFTEIEFLPDQISGQQLYEPGNNKREQEIRENLKRIWKEKYGY
jgi:putative ATPase